MSVTGHPQRRPWRPGEVPGRLPGARTPGGVRIARRRGASRRRAPAVPAAAARRSRWWVELLAITWLCWVYDAITNLAPLRRSVALEHAAGLLQLERLLHLDPELALNRWLTHHHTLGLWLSDYYDNAHFAVTLSLLFWLWWRRPDRYRPLRNSLVLVNVLGFVVFWRYPVAPPRMLTSSGFTDVVATTHAFGSFHSGALAAEANEYAAMPSLHMAWAAWCGLALWRVWTLPGRRLLAIVYPTVTAVAVLTTGNHFFVDVAAGLLVMAVAVVAVERLPRGAPRARDQITPVNAARAPAAAEVRVG